MNAETIAAKIRANVEALYANLITFEEFSATNFALWDAATAAGVADEVRLIQLKAR
jgi:hypothetical protein